MLTFYFLRKGLFFMQKLVGLVRRCVDDYRMLEPGDRVAVGVSGGKDSLALLVLLAALREQGALRPGQITVGGGISAK